MFLNVLLLLLNMKCLFYSIIIFILQYSTIITGNIYSLIIIKKNILKNTVLYYYILLIYLCELSLLLLLCFLF